MVFQPIFMGFHLFSPVFHLFSIIFPWATEEANYEVTSVDTTRDPAFEELSTQVVDMWYNKLMLRWCLEPLGNRPI